MPDPSSERISAAAVAKVARLARLDVADDEIARMTVQLAGCWNISPISTRSICRTSNR